MSNEERYIHIRNWDRFQHRDATRGNRPAYWIKSYTQQLGEYDFMSLTLRQQGILHGLRLLYALNRGRGLGASPARLGRMLGADRAREGRDLGAGRARDSIRMRDLERLSDAGFIEFSTSKEAPQLLAEVAHDVRLEETERREEKKTLAPAALEPVDNSTNEETVKPHKLARNGHEPDELWDTLATLFGPVAVSTNAHAKRNKAAADLRRQEATAETVRLAHERWPRVFQGASCTDTALATHYPRLVGTMREQKPACGECGIGGGRHLAGCSRTAAA